MQTITSTNPIHVGQTLMIQLSPKGLLSITTTSVTRCPYTNWGSPNILPMAYPYKKAM